MIRLTIPSIEEEDLRVVSETLATGYLVQGVQVKSFEEKIAAYTKAKYAVAVSNCTAALHLALLALNVKAGDLVAVSSYSWIATANVIELCGAQPVFIDIAPHTFNMSTELMRETLKRLMSVSATAKRVKAIIPVHAFGLMANMPEITQIAGEYNLPIIEDAACALGANINGKKASEWGAMGCFSFHPRKAITTGEGGIVTSYAPAIDSRLRSLRNHGLDAESATPDFIEPGFNYRMTEFQAALGCSQMDKLDRIIRARQEAARRYDTLLKDSAFVTPFVPDGYEHVYQSYIILLPKHLANTRADLIARLKEKGVETTIGTIHMPLTKYYSARYGYKAGEFPATDEIYARALTLPLYESITPDDQRFVVKNLLEFEKNIK